MARLWSKVGKVLGGLFLLGGGTVSIGLLAGIVTSQASGGMLVLLSVLLVIFGLAPTALGGVLLYTGSWAARRALRERFYHLLQLHRGRIALVDFAAATRLEPAIARRHLDTWAKECSASFEVSDRGDIYYVFATQPTSLPGSQGLEMAAQSLQRWFQTL